MKLNKRLFRSVPNPMYVSKSAHSESTDLPLTIGEITFTQEELYNLLSHSEPVVFLRDDIRLKTVKESNIIKVTNLNDATFCYELSSIENLPYKMYVMTFATGTHTLVLIVQQQETEPDVYTEDYSVLLLPMNFVDEDDFDSEIYSLQQQIDNIDTSKKYLHHLVGSDIDIYFSLDSRSPMDLSSFASWLYSLNYTSQNNPFICPSGVSLQDGLTSSAFALVKCKGYYSVDGSSVMGAYEKIEKTFGITGNNEIDISTTTSQFASPISGSITDTVMEFLN